MTKIQKKLQYIYEKIYIDAYNSNRNPQNINLIAVTKNQSIDKIKDAISFGQNNFGENYIQESLKKILWFQKNTKNKLIWHFIGSIQSNKSQIIAEYFDWCHTLNSPKLAYRLNSQRPKTLNNLNVLIQINISTNYNKPGIITANKMFELASVINQCPRLNLRGIMSMSIPSNQFKQQLLHCKMVNMFFKQLKSIHPYIDKLSLGMTNDMTPAIYSGSNFLRIGTAIFGPRPHSNNTI